MAEFSINSNHWMYESKRFLLSFYASKSCHLWEYTFKLVNSTGFSAHVQKIFPPFKQVWSLGFLWSIMRHFDRFFCLIFKMEFNPLPDLLNSGIVIIEISLFYSGKNLESKICIFQTFLDNMAMFNLSSRTTTCENTSNTSSR